MFITVTHDTTSKESACRIISVWTLKNGSMVRALRPRPFQKWGNGAKVRFHKSVIGNLMVY